MPKDKILVLEDDAILRELFCTFLAAKGYEVLSAENCSLGNRLWNSRRPDAAILDLTLPDGNSLELLSRWRAGDSQVPIIMLTGHGSIEVAVQAIKMGADQFLTKPADLATLHQMLQKAIEHERSPKSKVVANERQKPQRINPFLGASRAIREVEEMARKIATTESSVLISGETGAGKGVLARWIHESSVRGNEGFVDLNCAGLSRELLESELFGHERGAFTGAVETKAGLLEMGHRGTVFLDEIGDMEMQVQPRLLKVVEERTFRRLGDVRSRFADIRFISGTHQDLLRAVRERRFRADLYFRISTVPITIPPLRERPEDITILANYILEQIGKSQGFRSIEITLAARQALQSYPWPGNIRELRNVLERAVLLAGGTQISSEHLYFISEGPSVDLPISAPTSIKDFEREHIRQALIQANWRVAKAAKRLGLPRSSFYKKIKHYGLTRSVLQQDDMIEAEESGLTVESGEFRPKQIH
jgi:DNA-binding NtrC family response regulator